MLAIFVTLNHEILPIQRCDITLEGDTLPPNPASDAEGRLYRLKSMVAVIDPESDEPSILCWYQEIRPARPTRHETTVTLVRHKSFWMELLLRNCGV